MRKQDWHSRTFALSWLRERQNVKVPGARDFEVFEWLQAIGVVPADVDTVKYGRVNPILNLNANAIGAFYLAAVAFEWDTWGPSTPTEFLDALQMETAGNNRRDTVAETLSALGRAIAEEDSEDRAYRLRLPEGHAA